MHVQSGWGRVKDLEKPNEKNPRGVGGGTPFPSCLCSFPFSYILESESQ